MLLNKHSTSQRLSLLFLGIPFCDTYMAFAKSFHFFHFFSFNLVFKFTCLNTQLVIQVERIVYTTQLKEL